jgi:hypothetical protein
MPELQLDPKNLKTVKDHQYYLFPTPATHTNQTDRPTEYADEKVLKTYAGRGNNNSARLHPDVLTAANTMMCALLDYGDQINDWSMKSAVIQSGYRPDDASQGATYLRIIKRTITENPKIFGALTFPANLEADAQGVLGRRGDARRTAFQRNVAASPGWSADLMQRLFQIVDNAYAPRGSNPHATGFVFDLDFTIYSNGREVNVGADTKKNAAALKSAVGTWLNLYSMTYDFDSYDTGAEIWHMEYRKWKT